MMEDARSKAEAAYKRGLEGLERPDFPHKADLIAEIKKTHGEYENVRKQADAGLTVAADARAHQIDRKFYHAVTNLITVTQQARVIGLNYETGTPMPRLSLISSSKRFG